MWEGICEVEQRWMSKKEWKSYFMELLRALVQYFHSLFTTAETWR